MNRTIKFSAILLISTLFLPKIEPMKKLALLSQKRILRNKNTLFPIIKHSQPADKTVNSGFFSPYGWLMLVPFNGVDQAIPVEELFDEVTLGEIDIDTIQKVNLADIPISALFQESYGQVGRYYLYKYSNKHCGTKRSLNVPTTTEKRGALKYLFTKYVEKFKELEPAFKKHFRQFLYSEK